MKKNLLYSVGTALGVVVALAFNSCAYDPYYASGSSSYGGSYSSGYGGGGGYGGSSVSTSLFISTGDPRWGYDPYSHSYYDYRRSCYYDPYRGGYYASGYRPSPYGRSHPSGYSSRYCPPPSRVRNVTISGDSERQVRGRSTGEGSFTERFGRTTDASRNRSDLRVPDVSRSSDFESRSREARSGRENARFETRSQEFTRPSRSASSDAPSFRQQREQRTSSPEARGERRQQAQPTSGRAPGRTKRAESDEDGGETRNGRTRGSR
jgi:hypothetical protein